MGKRPKNSGNRSRKKKRRNLARNYLESLRQNYYIDGRRRDTKKRERKNGRKIGVNEKKKFLRTRKLEGETIL